MEAGAQGRVFFEGREVVLERQLGRGQYGVVFRATLDGQAVAVKILKEGVLGERLAQARADLMREVKILRFLDHPNIVRLIGSGCADSAGAGEPVDRCSRPFLITEYGGTRTLRTLIDGLGQHPVPFSVKESIMVQCLEAVAHMHSRGFAHHDLKPDNIFLQDSPQPAQPAPPERAARRAGSGLHAALRRAEAAGPGPGGGREEAVVVKLGDLGLADVVGGELFRRGKGTVLYAAPESFEHRMDLASDLWSLGVVFYELASCGELPFQGRNDSGLRRSIAEEEVRPVAARHALPAIWSHLILHGLLVREPPRRISAPAALALLHEHRLHSAPGGPPEAPAAPPRAPHGTPPEGARRGAGLGGSFDERTLRGGGGRLSRRAIADEVHRRLAGDGPGPPAPGPHLHPPSAPALRPTSPPPIPASPSAPALSGPPDVAALVGSLVARPADRAFAAVSAPHGPSPPHSAGPSLRGGAAAGGSGGGLAACGELDCIPEAGPTPDPPAPAAPSDSLRPASPAGGPSSPAGLRRARSSSGSILNLALLAAAAAGGSTRGGSAAGGSLQGGTAAGGSLRGGEPAAEAAEPEAPRRVARTGPRGASEGGAVHRSGSKHALDLSYLRTLVPDAAPDHPAPPAPHPAPQPVG